MFGFDTSNSIEPAAPARPVVARKPDRADIPIREATPTEMRVLRSRPAPHATEMDAVARRHNLYMAERRSTRIYYTDYQQKSEVIRAAPQRITTRLDDRQTLSAMLDLAQARGWQSVKLRGTASFRREAWVQAQVRGMRTEGYQPKATDMPEAQRRTVAATPIAQPALAPAESTAASTVRSPTVRSPAAKATKPVSKPVKSATASTEQPAPADASKTPQKRQAAVWGAVEAAGHQARQNNTAAASPDQKTAQKPATPPTAAAAA